MSDVNKFKVDDVVKCVDNEGFVDRLTIGKEYLVREADSDNFIIVNDDRNKGVCYYSYRFELSGDKSLQTPKFKDGDMVYFIGFDCLKPCKLLATSCEHLNGWLKVEKGDSFRMFTENGYSSVDDITPSLVLATEENRLMLNKLLGVEYEPVKLTGSDLAKKLLKGKPQTCYVSGKSDDFALSNKYIDLITRFECDYFITASGTLWKFAVPCDKHGDLFEDE